MDGPLEREPNEPKYKPRRTRGTPSFFYRNIFAAAGLSVGLIFIYFFEQSQVAERFRKRIRAGEFFDSPEQIEQRRLIRSSFILPKPRDQILKHLQEEEDYEIFPVFSKDEEN